MKLEINPKTLKPEFELEEKDLSDAFHIRAMMNTQGWKILDQYFQVGRESLIDMIKDSTRTKAGRATTDIKAAILKGYDEYAILAKKIVIRAEQFEDHKKAQEEINGTNVWNGE